MVGFRYDGLHSAQIIEASSLWRVRPPGSTPDEWGEEAAGEWPKHPLAKAKKVVGLKTEAHDDVTWLGDLRRRRSEKRASSIPRLAPSADAEQPVTKQ